MMDKFVNLLLSYKGIALMTGLILLIASLLYCRFVTGIGVGDAVGTLSGAPAPDFSRRKRNGSGGGSGGAHFAGLQKFLGVGKFSIGSEPDYDESDMTGGVGRGTVSETLVHETEKKIMNGERLDQSFVQGMPTYNSPVKPAPVRQAVDTTGVVDTFAWTVPQPSAPAPAPAPAPTPAPAPPPPPAPRPAPAPAPVPAPAPAPAPAPVQTPPPAPAPVMQQAAPQAVQQADVGPDPETIYRATNDLFDGFSLGDSYDA